MYPQSNAQKSKITIPLPEKEGVLISWGKII